MDSTWNTARPPGASDKSQVTVKELRKAYFRMWADAATSVDNLSILIVQRCFRELVIFFLYLKVIYYFVKLAINNSFKYYRNNVITVQKYQGLLNPPACRIPPHSSNTLIIFILIAL